ncbi:TPA: hypothetical protein ACJJF7_002215, partial [Neisseria meningitidis]
FPFYPINARNLKSRHSPKTKNQKQKYRHSRAGGNLDLRTTAIFKDYLKVRDSRFPLSWE